MFGSKTAKITFCIDNGAFSKHNTGKETDWDTYYEDFLPRWIDNQKLRFFVVPDTITGTEADNDRLIEDVPAEYRKKGAPVWHMHESFDKLVRLANEWEYVCIGSSGEYFSIRSPKWRERIIKAFELLHSEGYSAKIHGLRMLDGRVLGNYPLDQADSTNLATNVPKWKFKYPDITIEACRMQTHPTKWRPTADVQEAYDMLIAGGGTKDEMMGSRCAILKGAVEAVRPPTMSEWIEKRRRSVVVSV